MSITSRQADSLASEASIAKLYALLEQFELLGDTERFERLLEALERGSLLGLSDASIWEKVQADTQSPRQQKGLIGITTYGKRMVRSAAAVLQRDQRHRCAFFTGTVPPLASDQREVFNSRFSEIVKLFLKKFRYHVEAAGVEDFNYLFVNEIQEQRYLKTGEIYLHCHLIVTNKKLQPSNSKCFGEIGRWIVTIELATKLWREAVENAIGKVSWQDADIRIENPKSDLNRELGKYMSKGSQAAKLVREQGTTDQLPRHWYGVSDDLRAAVKHEIKVYRGDEAQAFLDNLKALERKGLAKLRKVVYWYTDASGQTCEGLAGYVGFVKLRASRFERLRMVA